MSVSGSRAGFMGHITTSLPCDVIESFPWHSRSASTQAHSGSLLHPYLHLCPKQYPLHRHPPSLSDNFGNKGFGQSGPDHFIRTCFWLLQTRFDCMHFVRLLPGWTPQMVLNFFFSSIRAWTSSSSLSSSSTPMSMLICMADCAALAMASTVYSLRLTSNWESAFALIGEVDDKQIAAIKIKHNFNIFSKISKKIVVTADRFFIYFSDENEATRWNIESMYRIRLNYTIKTCCEGHGCEGYGGAFCADFSFPNGVCFFLFLPKREKIADRAIAILKYAGFSLIVVTTITMDGWLNLGMNFLFSVGLFFLAFVELCRRKKSPTLKCAVRFNVKCDDGNYVRCALVQILQWPTWACVSELFASCRTSRSIVINI